MSDEQEKPAEIPQLSGAEKSELRSLLQTLDPVIIIGKHGITQSVVKEIEAAFKSEDLIKLKFSGDRKEIAEQIITVSEATRSAVVGSVGKTAGFYRPAKTVEE